MISMTGYGESIFTLLGIRFYYRLRSLNSRFFEINFHFPIEIKWFEPFAETLIRDRFQRGKIEVYLECESAIPKEPKLNEKLIQEYQRLFSSLYPKKKIQVPIEALVHLPGFLEMRSENLKNHQSKLESYLMRAAMRLERQKQKEGRKILQYVKPRFRLLNRLNHKVGVLNGQHLKKQKRVISDKVNDYVQENQIELLKGNKILNQYFVRQIAQFKEDVTQFFYSDITEEIERLNIHLTAVLGFIDVEDIVGKKIEFFLQEILREVNTLTAKTKDSKINHQGIQMKSEIEKIREQVRNIE